VPSLRAQIFEGYTSNICAVAALGWQFFWDSLVGWFSILLLIVIGIPIFAWAYRRHLDVLTGPWIANEISRND
jgi:hypothetical protein